MKSRKQLLEEELGSCEKEYLACERALKEHQELLRKAPSLDNEEFQRDLSNKISAAEDTEKNMSAAKERMNEIRAMLKSRQDHFKENLDALNKGLNPESKINDEQVQLSSIITRLAIQRAGIDHAAAKTNNHTIANSDGSINIIESFDLFLSNKASSKPDAIIITEYCVKRDKTSSIPSIHLVSDKAILCHERANDLFFPGEINTTKLYQEKIETIRELLENEFNLKILTRYIEEVDKFSEADALALSLIQSKHHLDWLLLHKTLVTLINQAGSNKQIENYLASSLCEKSTQAQFFQQAKNILLRAFEAEKLSTGLANMQSHAHLDADKFIEFCRKEVLKRGAESYSRPQETKDLYTAITNILFKKSKDGQIDTACLNQLEKAVHHYLNPPKSQKQLHHELKKYEKQRAELLREIRNIKYSLILTKEFCNNSSIFLNDNKQTIFDLENKINKGEPIPIITYGLNAAIDLDKRKIIFYKGGHDKNLQLHFSKNSARFRYRDLSLQNNDPLEMSFNTGAKNTHEEPKDNSLLLERQKLTAEIDLDNYKTTINIEGSSANSGNLNHYEIPLSINNNEILINVRNQSGQAEELELFRKYFSNMKMHYQPEDNDPDPAETMSAINETIKTIKDYSKFVTQKVFMNFIRHFPQGKINEIVESATFLLAQHQLILNKKIIPDTKLIDEIRLQIKYLQKETYKILDWYANNIDYKFKLLNPLIKYFISTELAKFDIFQLQDQLASKTAMIKQLENQMADTKSLLQPLFTFYNEAGVILAEFFRNNTFDSEGLNEMKQHCSSHTLNSIELIEYCQEKVNQRGISWNRAKATTKIYDAISKIQFDEKNDVNKKCLEDLKKALCAQPQAASSKSSLFGQAKPPKEDVKHDNRNHIDTPRK
jgi:hypothetical protein